MESEIVNITKIKDGYFLGDEATAANLDVIFQFKITHMINAAGPQILNAWENIGTKYLTLNWTESPNQNLFDPKDEIANRIVGFIDDSFKTGEGFLVHSVRGQNRACLVVIIYFIRKYRWTLKKSMEFLSSKKNDIDVPPFFINQLSSFETRLTKGGQGPKSSNWNDVGTGQLNDIDNEEVLIRNTYLNGIVTPSIDDLLIFKNGQMKRYTGRKIVWSDQTEKRSLILVSSKKDLLLQNPKEMKPILSHKKMKPAKSSIKGSNQVPITNSNNKSRYYGDYAIPEEMSIANDQNTSFVQRVNKFSANFGSSQNSIDNTIVATNNFMQNQNQVLPSNFQVNESDQGKLNQKKDVGQQERLSNSVKAPPNHSFLRDNSIKRDKYSTLSHTSKQQNSGTTNYYDYYTNNIKTVTKPEDQKKNTINKQDSSKSYSTPNIGMQRPSTADNSSANILMNNNYGIDFKENLSNNNSSNKIIISPQVQNIVNTNIYIQQDDVRKIIGNFGFSSQQPSSNYGNTTQGNQTSINQSTTSTTGKGTEIQRNLNNDYFNSSNAPNNFMINQMIPKNDPTNQNYRIGYKSGSGSSNNMINLEQYNNYSINQKPELNVKKTSNLKPGKNFLAGQNAGSQSGGNLLMDSSLKKNYMINRQQYSAGPVKLQTNDYFKKPMTPDTSSIAQPNKYVIL